MQLKTDTIQSRLRGVSVGIVTPFNENGTIDHGKLQSNARALYEKGVRSFLAVANISEYHSLSQSERIDVARSSVEALPPDACVLAGVGGGTPDASKLIRAYNELDVDAMMIMPPDHTFVHEQGLLRYYETLGDISERALVPYVRGYQPSSEFLAELTSIGTVIGIKYALTDMLTLGSAIQSGSDDVVWVNGLGEPYALATWAEGCEGFTAGVSNFRPEVGLGLYEALAEQNWKRARDVRDIGVPYQTFRSGTGEDNVIPDAKSVPAIKKGLDLAGLHGGQVRAPLHPLTASAEHRAETLYEDLEADIERLSLKELTANQ